MNLFLKSILCRLKLGLHKFSRVASLSCIYGQALCLTSSVLCSTDVFPAEGYFWVVPESCHLANLTIYHFLSLISTKHALETPILSLKYCSQATFYLRPWIPKQICLVYHYSPIVQASVSTSHSIIMICLHNCRPNWTVSFWRWRLRFMDLCVPSH